MTTSSTIHKDSTRILEQIEPPEHLAFLWEMECRERIPYRKTILNLETGVFTLQTHSERISERISDWRRARDRHFTTCLSYVMEMYPYDDWVGMSEEGMGIDSADLQINGDFDHQLWGWIDSHANLASTTNVIFAFFPRSQSHTLPWDWEKLILILFPTSSQDPPSWHIRYPAIKDLP